jgi:hypothetical protein
VASRVAVFVLDNVVRPDRPRPSSTTARHDRETTKETLPTCEASGEIRPRIDGRWSPFAASCSAIFRVGATDGDVSWQKSSERALAAGPGYLPGDPRPPATDPGGAVDRSRGSVGRSRVAAWHAPPLPPDPRGPGSPGHHPSAPDPASSPIDPRPWAVRTVAAMPRRLPRTTVIAPGSPVRQASAARSPSTAVVGQAGDSDRTQGAAMQRALR